MPCFSDGGLIQSHFGKVRPITMPVAILSDDDDAGLVCDRVAAKIMCRCLAAASGRCPSRSEARSWPRNRRESDECRLKLRGAAMKATQRRHDLGQSIWLDNSTRDMLTSGTLKHRAVSDRADSEPDDPRPRNQEQRFLRCRDPREAQGRQGPAAHRRRIPEEISVVANPLSASQRNLLHKGDPE